MKFGVLGMCKGDFLKPGQIFTKLVNLEKGPISPKFTNWSFGGVLMKTGMEYGLIGLIVLVALGLLMSFFNAQQVEMAAAQVTATTATAQMPMAAAFLGQMGGWLVKFTLGLLIAALAGLLVAWVRSKMRPQSRRAWRSGPNAQWQQREPRQQSVTSADLLKLMMMQQNGQRPPQGRGQAQNNSDEPKIWS